MSVATATKKPKRSKGGTPGGNATGDADSAGARSGGRGLSGFYAAGPAVALGGAVQTKVKVGKPGDRFEKEADHVADKVTHGEKAPAISRIPAGGLDSQRQTEEPQEAQKQEEETQETHEKKAQEMSLQRQGEEEAQERGEEEKAQMQEEEAQELSLQRAGEEETQKQPEEESQGKEEETQELRLQRQEEEEEAQSQTDETQEQEEEKTQQQEEEEAQSQPEEAQEQEEQEAAQSQEEETQEQEEETREWSLQRQEEETQPQEEDAQELHAQQQEEDEVQSQEEETQEQSEEEPAQEKSAEPAAANRERKEEVASRAIHSRGAGEPLDPGVRYKLETGMGVDLSGVRVHTDSRAQQAAKAMKARAFTHKQHVWLANGESKFDEKLMAHETTHVLQQGALLRRQPQSAGAEAADRRPGTQRAEAQRPGPALAEPKSTEPRPPAASSAPSASREDRAPTASAAAAAPEAAGPVPEATTTTPEEVSGPIESTEEATAAEGEPSEAAGAVPPPPEDSRKPSQAAGKDRRFQGVIKRLEQTATQEKAHEPAQKKVADAQAAAEPPANDQSSRAQANQVDLMSQAEADKPDKESFLDMLRAQLARIAPSNMEETEEFKKKGKAGKLKSALTANVQQQKADSERQIKETTAAKPDPSSVAPKPVTPMPEEPQPPPLADLQAEKVLPLPKKDKDISLDANKKKVDDLMAENDIDEEQLEKANEPQFSEALEAKREVEEHADQVPETYREEETGFLRETEAEVKTKEETAKTEMRRQRVEGAQSVKAKQDEEKKKEEQERKRVAGEIEKLYENTREKVEGKLNSLDEEVNKKFDDGEAAARERFESYVDRKMSDYKWDRYINRFGGSLLWAKDKLFGMPDEVNRFYEEGRDQYIEDMDAVLVDIADTVEKTLAEAKKEIIDGKHRIQEFVDNLPIDLQKAGQEASEKVSARFDELEQKVESKKEELAQKMAQKYKQARDKLDERIEELKAQNQGLVDAFIGKIKEIIEILRKFKDRIVSLLTAGAGVIRKIVKDPIAFLKNLLSAVKKGFFQFRDNILAHLKKGMLSWLFGTLSKAGIQIPSDFSVKSIFGLVLQLLGLTKERLRAKLAKLIGEKNVARLEAAWGVVSTLISEGPGGLWVKVKEFFSDLKETVMGQIRNWLITQVIKQAVIWVVSLFNPASALLKAVKLIIDVVMFFVENIDRILKLVEAVIKSVGNIVAGKIGAAADYIEQTMARTLPVMISFLARLLGLGGLATKIQSIIRSIQKRVDRAVDKALKTIVKGIKKVFGTGKAAARKAAAKVKEFLYPKQPFQVGSQRHTIFFEGKGPDAVPMVSSRPRTLTALLNELAATPENAKKQDKVNSVRAHLSALTRFQNSLKNTSDEGAQETIRKKIRLKIKEISVLLADLMQKEEIGDKANPIPLDWPKPSSDKYPELYFGPKSDRRLPQRTLKSAYGGDARSIGAIEKKLDPDEKKKWKKEGYKVSQYAPHGSASLPDGEGPIGIMSPWRVFTGKALQLPEERRSTPGGGRLLNLVRPYGFQASHEKLDGDHVVEIQVGGKDELGNLWPLNRSINRASGKILSRTIFDVNKKRIPMSVLKARAQQKKDVHMVIKSTR